MTEILKGKPVADALKEQIRLEVLDFQKRGISPALAVVRVGEGDSDISYEKAVVKAGESLGILVKLVHLPADTTTETLQKEIQTLNGDRSVHGILMFRPLPKHIDQELLQSMILPEKDVDAMHALNLEKVFEGDPSGLEPATPRAAVEMLRYHGVDLVGKDVVVINRSMVVGKPLAMMLLQENATVTICHSRTKDLKEHTRRADVVVTALGRPASIDRSYFTEHSVVIDVGVGMTADGKLSGDVCFDDVSAFVRAITPVPGGVGSITTTILLRQVLKACAQQNAASTIK